METLGQYLKTAREQHGFTQEALAKASKYHLSKIQALEEDRHQDLPAIPYVKGMLRAISKLLSLNTAETLSRYETFLKRLEVEIEQQAPKPKVEITPPLKQDPFYKRKNFLTVSASLVFLVLVVVSAVLFQGRNPKEPTGPTVEETPSLSPESTPILSSSEQGNKMIIQPLRDVWFKIQIDDEKPYSLAMRAQETHEMMAKKVIRFFVSDAEGLKITLNDQALSNERTGPQTFVFSKK